MSAHVALFENGERKAVEINRSSLYKHSHEDINYMQAGKRLIATIQETQTL